MSFKFTKKELMPENTKLDEMLNRWLKAIEEQKKRMSKKDEEKKGN